MLSIKWNIQGRQKADQKHTEYSINDTTIACRIFSHLKPYLTECYNF